MPVVRLENFQQFTAVNVLSDPGHIGGPIIIPNAIRVLFNWTLEDGKIAHNILCGQVAAGFTPTVAQANSIFAGLSTGATATAFLAFLAPSTQFTGVSLLDIRTANQPLVTSNTAAVPGTSASPALPNEVAVVVTLRTALTGQSGRGRSYIPGYATNALGAGNVVAAAAVTATNNWANLWGVQFTNQGLTICLALPARAAYTGATGTQHPARAARTQPLTAALVRDNHWDTQRRRGLK